MWRTHRSSYRGGAHLKIFFKMVLYQFSHLTWTNETNLELGLGFDNFQPAVIFCIIEFLVRHPCITLLHQEEDDHMARCPVGEALSPSIRSCLSPAASLWMNSDGTLSPRWMNCSYSRVTWYWYELCDKVYLMCACRRSYRGKGERRVSVSCFRMTPWVARRWAWTGSSGTTSRSGWGTWWHYKVALVSLLIIRHNIQECFKLLRSSSRLQKICKQRQASAYKDKIFCNVKHSDVKESVLPSLLCLMFKVVTCVTSAKAYELSAGKWKGFRKTWKK